MSHHGSFLSRALAAHGALAAMAIVLAGASPAVAQTVRNYNVNKTNVAPTIDGAKVLFTVEQRRELKAALLRHVEGLQA